jgi:hypothetical protein
LDTFGNLYLTYLSEQNDKGEFVHEVVVLISTDSGATFQKLEKFCCVADLPSVVVADTVPEGAVWILWTQQDERSSYARLYTSHATVRGLGDVDKFSTPSPITIGEACTSGDIAIGPSGVVITACQTMGDRLPLKIVVNTDRDRPGDFSTYVVAATTNVTPFEWIKPHRRHINAEVGLAFDKYPKSPHFGRLYLVYTEKLDAGDTDILVRFSDDKGKTWSESIRVNDDLPGYMQFLPRIAVDPLSGNIAVCWLDARYSDTNTAVQTFCSIATPTGDLPNFSPEHTDERRFFN